jgi:hypothetical protein
MMFMGGLELTIGRINISSDFNPLITVNQNDQNKDYYGYGGLSVRYVLDARESKAKKWVARTKDKI